MEDTFQPLLRHVSLEKSPPIENSTSVMADVPDNCQKEIEDCMPGSIAAEANDPCMNEKAINLQNYFTDLQLKLKVLFYLLLFIGSDSE